MNVFTYGSLMFDPVWSGVVRGRYRSLPAVVADHARHAVRGETYPGVVERAGAEVRGRLWLDVSADDLARLDAFEGADYRRVTVSVSAGEPARAMQAQMYLYVRPERLEAAPWDEVWFEREGIARFLRAYCAPPQT